MFGQEQPVPVVGQPRRMREQPGVHAGQLCRGIAADMIQPEAVRGGGRPLHRLARAPAKALAPLDEEPSLAVQHRWELPATI